MKRFPWGRRMRGNVLRPEAKGAGMAVRRWRDGGNTGHGPRPTVAEVLVMHGDVVPAGVGSSFSCYPVVHVVLAV